MKLLAILFIALFSVALIAGCTGGINLGDSEAINESQVQSAFNDFESTLIDEGDVVEIGSLI
jgi:hypothetical protein